MSEGYRTRAAKLSAAARRLNAGAGPGADAPFSLAFLTGGARGPDPVMVARALPAGAAVILRDYASPRRAALARRLRSVTARREVLLVIGGDARLAEAVGADGLHLRACQLGAPPYYAGLVTAACHDEGELALAARADATLALLSPVYPTRTHPGAPALGPERFRAMAATAPIPVLALGGVDEHSARRLGGRQVAGLAAISAFAPR